jgi:hypothetical protein
MDRDRERYNHSEAKKIRDQAYTHLKEAVKQKGSGKTKYLTPTYFLFS